VGIVQQFSTNSERVFARTSYVAPADPQEVVRVKKRIVPTQTSPEQPSFLDETDIVSRITRPPH
jgi:hypothetical protein